MRSAILCWFGALGLVTLGAACVQQSGGGTGGGSGGHTTAGTGGTSSLGGAGGTGAGDTVSTCTATITCCMWGLSGPCCLPCPDGGAPCNGPSPNACPSGQLCASLFACGQTGYCTVQPASCGTESKATCGCDGKVYGNPCEALAAGVDSSSTGGCTAPTGTFACGASFCTQGAEYCEHNPHSWPQSFTCKALPAACGNAPACACLAGASCGTQCTAAGGDLTVTCS